MGTNLRPNIVPHKRLYGMVSRFDFFLAPWWGWDAVVLEDDQVLFQYCDLNDRVYYVAVFWGPKPLNGLMPFYPT